MSIAESIANFVGGSAFKEAKELITSYWPPDVSPEQRAEFDLKLRELEARKASEAATIAQSQLQSELADMQDARKAHTLSNMPAVITVMLTIMAGGLLYAVIFLEIRESSRELAFALFGTVFTLWSTSISYWVGTTRNGAVKTDIIARSDAVK
jgi:hypothetical protein